MLEKVREVHPPRGLARLAYRFPIWLYRIGLGGLLGKRFLLLEHTGRKSGLLRKTVLEVVRYDPDPLTFVVAAGFGMDSDWYQNLRADRDVTVQCGRERWRMRAEFLSSNQGGEEMLNYASRYPSATKALAGIMGYRIDGSRESIRQLGENLSMVMFHKREL